MATAGPPSEGRYGERVFRPEDRGEDERIDLGALAYDDTTMARLRQLGAGPGWTCLEVGAGTGTVARRLLGEAGVARVLAVDRDVRFLAEHPVPGLTALQADVTSEDFSPGCSGWSTPASCSCTCPPRSGSSPGSPGCSPRAGSW